MFLVVLKVFRECLIVKTLALKMTYRYHSLIIKYNEAAIYTRPSAIVFGLLFAGKGMNDSCVCFR